MAGKRYLILARGASGDPQIAKTMHGVMRYAPDPTVAIVDPLARHSTIGSVPVVGSVGEGLAHGPTTAIVGVAPAGGMLDPLLRGDVLDAIGAGLDVEAGLHTFLADDPTIARAAAEHGVRLVDLRRPPDDLGVPTGANGRHDALVIHTVGSDCAIGKKTVALEMDLEARRRGLRSMFVPTGQTGIAIAGWGIAVDAVIADFVAGAAERSVIHAAARADVLWVEGQGSLVHPSYAGVTLGLYHGALPHLLVLCHRAGSKAINGRPDHPIPPLPELLARYEAAALPIRPAIVAAIALNTMDLDTDAAAREIERVQEEVGLTADDPVRFGAGRSVDAVWARAAAIDPSRWGANAMASAGVDG